MIGLAVADLSGARNRTQRDTSDIYGVCVLPRLSRTHQVLECWQAWKRPHPSRLQLAQTCVPCRFNGSARTKPVGYCKIFHSTCKLSSVLWSATISILFNFGGRDLQDGMQSWVVIVGEITQLKNTNAAPADETAIKTATVATNNDEAHRKKYKGKDADRCGWCTVIEMPATRWLPRPA